MIIFHLTICMIHYLYFFVFYGWFLNFFEKTLVGFRDIKNSIDTAKREGKEEGLAEGMEKGLAEGMEKGLAEGMEKGMSQRSLEIARTMLAKGMDAATVMEITGLSERQLKQLKE